MNRRYRRGIGVRLRLAQPPGLTGRERYRVEDHLRSCGIDATNRQRRRAADALLLQIERQIESEVIDDERTIALEVTLGARKRDVGG